MIERVCDRCGYSESKTPAGKYPYHVVEFSFDREGIVSHILGRKKRIDLCEECFLAFKKHVSPEGKE